MSNCANQTFRKQNKFLHDEDLSDSSEESKVETTQLKTQDTITFVTIADIYQLIKQKCQDISEILNISDDEALIILNYYKWRIELLENDWFEDPVKLRKEAGIQPKEAAKIENSAEILCSKCYETKSRQEFDSIACNHLICNNCWADYIQSNVTRPENAFFWRCPVEGCHLVVPDSFNQKHITDEQRIQYEKRKIMTYTHNSKTFKWCPIPTCQYGVEITDKNIQAIECPCGHVYCKECEREDHRPWVCEVAVDWLQKCKQNIPVPDELTTWVNSFKRCEAELKIIEDLSKELKLQKSRDSNDLIDDTIQGAYKTLKDTKRLEKWSYAYQPFIDDELDGGVLKIQFECRQHRFEEYTKELQTLLQDFLQERDYSRFKQYAERIRATELNCKKHSAVFLNKVVDRITYLPKDTVEREPIPQNLSKRTEIDQERRDSLAAVCLAVLTLLILSFLLYFLTGITNRR